MTNKDQCRETFEEWARSQPDNVNLTREGSGYRHAYAECFWEAWQAARSTPSAPVELPEPIGVVRVFEPHEGAGKICSEASTDITRLPIGRSLLYTEPQVRELLSQAGAVVAETPESPPKSTETRMDASSDRGGGVLPEPEVDLPRAGQKALDEYLKWCKEHSIVPDVGGAFAHAIRAGAEIAAAPKLPQGDGWLPIESAPKDQLVMVYSPPQKDDDPDAVRIEFDHIDSGIEDEYWFAHGESYEHFCYVGKPEGCTGPSEKAPYTHWHPIPQPPREQGS